MPTQVRAMINVSEVEVETEEVVFSLKKNILLKDVCHNILRQRLIYEAAQARNLTVTPEEIQVEADRLRQEYQLQRATDTLAWLADQLITAEDWEAGINERLLAQKLAEALFAFEVDRYFAQHRLDFEQALLYQTIIPYEQVAQEVFYEIEEEEISFYQAAHLYDTDERRRNHCGWEGAVYRWSLKPAISALVFAAQPGAVVGPIQTEQGFHLLMVEEFVPAQLTPETRQEILQKMFQEWLQNELNYLLSNNTPNHLN